MRSFRGFVEWVMPWYKPCDQEDRDARTAELGTRARAALVRSHRASKRAEAMLTSYERAQERVWH